MRDEKKKSEDEGTSYLSRGVCLGVGIGAAMQKKKQSESKETEDETDVKD